MSTSKRDLLANKCRAIISMANEIIRHLGEEPVKPRQTIDPITHEPERRVVQTPSSEGQANGEVPGGATSMLYGKYKGRTVQELFDGDDDERQYITWLNDNTEITNEKMRYAVQSAAAMLRGEEPDQLEEEDEDDLPF